MSKKFSCPNCSKTAIEFVEEGFTRISNVVRVLTEEKVEESFLYSLSNFKPRLRLNSYYRCTSCHFSLGSSIRLIRNLYFAEEPKQPKVTTSTVKIREISHCVGDTPTIREHTDLINLIIRTAGGKITFPNDNSPETIKTQKLIRERQYLFDRRG